MILVYIAGKFRGATPWEVHQNVCEAERWAFEVAQLGAMPVCPHTNTKNFDGTLTAEFWLAGTLELMRRCDAVFMTPNWRTSSGSRAELKEALRIWPVFKSLEVLSAWMAALRSGDTRELALSIMGESRTALARRLAEVEGRP